LEPTTRSGDDEDDWLAQRLYAAAGFRRTEGDGGPLTPAYEREL